MVTEGGAHVVINFESVRHVNIEAFFLKLEGKSIAGQESHASSPKLWVVTCITRFQQGLGNPRPKEPRQDARKGKRK